MNLNILESEAEKFLDEKLEQLLSPSVLKNVDKDGAILSSSPLFLVSKIAKRLNVSLFAGTEYEVDIASCLCKIRSVVTGLEKKQIAEKWCQTFKISPKALVAWSDSVDDLPLLYLAGKVVAVRPSRALKKIAIKNQWQIWSED